MDVLADARSKDVPTPLPVELANIVEELLEALPILPAGEDALQIYQIRGLVETVSRVFALSSFGADRLAQLICMLLTSSWGCESRTHCQENSYSSICHTSTRALWNCCKPRGNLQASHAEAQVRVYVIPRSRSPPCCALV